MKFFCIARPNTEISWKTETRNKARDNISGKIYNINNLQLLHLEQYLHWSTDLYVRLK